jgi:hypothetical protein
MIVRFVVDGVRIFLLFLKKKKQKDFLPVLAAPQAGSERAASARAAPQALPNGKSFFGSFFSKKEQFSPSMLILSNTSGGKTKCGG